MVRHTIPERCNKPARFYSVINGYRCCDDHHDGSPIIAESATVVGRCDYPMDGLGAAKYVPLNRANAPR